MKQRLIVFAKLAPLCKKHFAADLAGNMSTLYAFYQEFLQLTPLTGRLLSQCLLQSPKDLSLFATKTSNSYFVLGHWGPGTIVKRRRQKLCDIQTTIRCFTRMRVRPETVAACNLLVVVILLVQQTLKLHVVLVHLRFKDCSGCLGVLILLNNLPGIQPELNKLQCCFGQLLFQDP